MRVIKSLLALCFVALGVLFGALNTQRVAVDLGLYSVEGRLGVVLLSVLLVGAFIGGLVVTASMVWPLRRAMHRQRGAGSGSGPDAQDLLAGRGDAR
jgi:putative membrane protein